MQNNREKGIEYANLQMDFNTLYGIKKRHLFSQIPLAYNS